MLGDELLQRLARPGGIAELELAAADVEQRVGHLLAVRIARNQLALRGDRAAEILLRKLGVADPVLRRRRERALRVRLDEGLEPADRRGIVATLELLERGIVAP